MSVDDLKKAFKILRNAEKGVFIGPRSDDLICLAETKLGLKFPPTYREFLKEFGAGGVSGIEIYGIINSDFVNSEIPDAIWLTLKYREKWQLPRQLVIIYDYDDGVYCAIDTSKASAGHECPIVAWESGLPEDKLEVIAEDFGEFLIDLLEASKEE